MIDVTAAVIENDGRYLLGRRKSGSHLAGKWEFPGGKIEPGESPETCLARELMEEFCVESEINEFLCESVFHYPGKSVRLLAYRVMLRSEINAVNDHDRIAWVSAADFADFDFAPADLPIVDRIGSFRQDNKDID